jgi:hypothetical protein
MDDWEMGDLEEYDENFAPIRLQEGNFAMERQLGNGLKKEVRGAGGECTQDGIEGVTPPHGHARSTQRIEKYIYT